MLLKDDLSQDRVGVERRETERVLLPYFFHSFSTVLP